MSRSVSHEKQRVLRAMGLVSVILLTGCGGGGGDDGGGGGIRVAAPLTTANEVAKAAAAVLVAYHVNNEAYYRAGEDIFDPVGTYACASGGNFTVSNKSAPDSEDGVVQYASCQKSVSKIISGRMVVSCPNAECDPTNTSATHLAHESTLAGGLKFSIAGNYRWDGMDASPSILERETWSGRVDFQRSGLNSSMDLLGGLVSDVYGGLQRSISGALSLTGGNVHNCPEGEFSYRSTSHLNVPGLTGMFPGYKTTAGALEISSGGKVAGTVRFNADGGVRVDLVGAAGSVDIPFSQFEQFCNLKETYSLLR